MQNSMVMFFAWNYPIWTILVQKIKIVNLSWNLVLRLIWICRIQRWCSFYLFCTWKVKFVSLSWNLGPLLIRICRMQWCYWLFCFGLKTNLSGKIVFLSWNLVLRLNRICIIQRRCLPFCFGPGQRFWPFWSKKSKLPV